MKRKLSPAETGRLLETFSADHLIRQLVEGAALTGTDEGDENKYRRLTAAKRDLNPMEYERASKMAFYLWQRNPLAGAIIDIVVDFCVGDEFRIEIGIKSRDADGKVADTGRKDGQVVWDAFCEDPVNNFYEEIGTLFQDALLFGELLLPVITNSVNGHIRYGYVDTSAITSVKNDATGKQAELVMVRVPDSVDVKIFKPVRIDIDPNSPTYNEFVGDAFFFRSNRVMNQTRGHSELMNLLDWIDGLDQFMFNNLEGAALRNAFFYWLKLDGKTEAQLEKFQVAPPRPGSVKVSNEKAEWSVITPDLKASDTAESTRMFKNFILGSKRIPEHWFADGGNTNLATAKEMDVPTMQYLRKKQRWLKQIAKTIALFVVKNSPDVKLSANEFIDVAVNMFDFERKNVTGIGAAFQQTVAALMVAKNNNWISDDKAKSVVDGFLQRYGVDVDPDETVEIIRQENATDPAGDIYSNAGPVPGRKPSGQQPGQSPVVVPTQKENQGKLLNQ